MSYASISTVNRIGERPPLPGLSGQFRFLSGGRHRGLGSLGQDVSFNDLVDAGVDPGIATTIISMGATDAQLEAVIQNPDSADAAVSLLTQLSGNGPAPGQPSGTAANFPTPSALQSQSLQQTGYDLTDPASWYDITGQLQQANQKIKTLEQLVISNPTAYASLIGQDAINLRTQYTNLAAQWTQVYVTVIGQQPAGLSGAGIRGRIARLGALGVAPIIIGAAIIAAAAVVIAGLVTLNTYIQSTSAKAQAASTSQASQAASSTQQSLINQINQAQQNAQAASAAGNATLAQQYLNTAQALAAQLASTGYQSPITAGSTLATWFTANWGWVAVMVGVVALGPMLIKKL